MSEWHELEPPAKGAPTKAPVRFSLQKYRGGPPRGSVLIQKDVLAELGVTNFNGRIGCRVRAGSGARAHQLSIVIDQDGPFELQEAPGKGDNKPYRVRLPVIAKWPDTTLPQTERSYKIEKEKGKPILVIDLPAVIWNRQLGSAA